MAEMSVSCPPKTRCVNALTFCSCKSWSDGHRERSGRVETAGDSKGCGHLSPNFEVIGGLLYRKKLEKGFINYREVLEEDRRHEAVSTFHCRRPGQQHLSLEETYKSVAENYWWEGMYFQIRNFVLSCQQCQSHTAKKNKESSGRGCVSKTMASHSTDILDKLNNQREAGLFCDITLRTNGRSFSAHKAVLAAVSDHFQEIFMEMDSSMKADVDLTGFSEDNLLSLLDFSYSSTLCVRWEDLPEVITMARHLGMWPAVEACSALMKEEVQHTGKGFNLACAGACRDHLHQQKESKKKRVSDEDVIPDGFNLLLDVSAESLEGSPRRNLRRKVQSHNGLPMSPSHRIRLMDFKSPSTKKPVTPRHTVASLQPQKYSPISPSNTRLLRSSPGAAKEVQRLLPMSESKRPIKKTRPVALHARSSRSRQNTACSPVRIKQEVEDVGEDEEDYARAQEKYKLMNVLGLQRTALLPRPEDLIGWRQKKRLRKLKVNNYSLTKRRKPQSNASPLPYGDMTLSLPLCNPANTRLLNTSGRMKPVVKVGTEKVTAKRPKAALRVPPTDRSMRSKGVLPDLFQPGARSPFGARQLRRSVRMEDRSLLFSHQPRRRNTNKPPVRNTVRIKSEPVEHSISGFSSDSLCGNTSCRSPPPHGVQARKKGRDAEVKTVRYNSGRPASKPKPKQASAKQAEEIKCKSREEGRKVESQRLKGVVDARLGFKDNSESSGPQFSEHGPPPSIYSHPLYKVIKEEPADPVPVGGPFPDPPSPDLGKRQSKPPIKLLDSGFLFSFCRSAGGPMAAIKKEEESVDICLTRSVSQVGKRFGSEEPPHRALRNRGPPTLPVVKKERKERKVSHNRYQRPRGRPRNNTMAGSAATQVTQVIPKQKGKVQAVSGRNCVMLDAVRRARLKQLRGPRSQAPTAPKAAHACLQCPDVYKDCDALIMHRLRHVNGKHWPCPLCSKTFFRLRNVRNHIRNHDPKLYKCRSCIVAGS